MAESETMQAGEEIPAGEAASAMTASPSPERRQTDVPASAEQAEITVEREPDEKPVASTAGGSVVDLKRIHSIKVLVQAVLGGVSLSVSRLSELKEGEVIPLGTKIGDPIDILTNGQLIARGEIVVIEGPENKFGIQITSLEPQGST